MGAELCTRYMDVASHVDQNSFSHQLRLQTKDESWDLFLPETSQPEISPDVDMQKLKKKNCRKSSRKMWGLATFHLKSCLSIVGERSDDQGLVKGV